MQMGLSQLTAVIIVILVISYDGMDLFGIGGAWEMHADAAGNAGGRGKT